MPSKVNCSNAAFFVAEDGAIYAVGINDHGELGNESYLTSDYVSTPVVVQSSAAFQSVSAGAHHVLALDRQGKVYSWGSNECGQLGLGDFSSRTTPKKISVLNETKSFSFVAIAGEATQGSFSQYGATSYSVVENPSKGTLTIDENGDYSYTCDSAQSGKDIALISMVFSGITIEYQVNITIDKRPIFMGGTPSFHVECGQSHSSSAHAIDADGDTLVYSVSKQPRKGTLTLDSEDGSYTYLAGVDMAGDDDFIISVTDGYCTVDYPVNVHVQSLITYSDNTEIELDRNLANEYKGNVQAVDIDGDALSYSVARDGGKGTVTIDADGNYRYVPEENAYGEDSFVLKVDDGYRPLEITYTVHLFAVKDAGTVQLAKITKGTTYHGSVLTEAKGATPHYSVSSQPAKGAITLNEETGEYSYVPNVGSIGDDSFSITVDYGFKQYSLTIHVYQNSVPDGALVSTSVSTLENSNYSGSAGCVDIDGDALSYAIATNPAKGSIDLHPTTGDYIYYPNPDIAGNDAFAIEVSDGIDSVTVEIDMHIESLIATNESISHTIRQNTSLSSRIEASDKDGDTLVYELSSNATNGVATIDSLTGDYTYIPNNNYFGDDSFDVKIDDGVTPKTVTVHIFVNRRPIADRLQINLTTEGVTATGTAACTDPDGDPLSYSLVEQPLQGNVLVNSSTGGFAYTPNADARGDDDFQIRASDGCDDILVNVRVHNETPVEFNPEQPQTIVVNQGKTTNGQVLAFDLDGDELSYSVSAYPTQGTVNLNSFSGAWTYTAKQTAQGRDSFTVEVTDGNNAIQYNYELVVNAPASFSEESYSISTNQNVAYIGIVSAVDADGDALTYSVVEQGQKGTTTIDPSSGRYRYAPQSGAAGNDVFYLGVSDGAFVTEVAVHVRIDSDISLSSDALTLNVQQNDVATGSVGASDPDGDTLSYSISEQAKKGSASVSADGNFTYFANSDAGNDSFIVSVTDGVHVAYVTVYVRVRSNPYFEDASFTIVVGKGGTQTGTLKASDADGDSLTFFVKTNPSKGTLKLNTSTGEFTYTASSSTAASSDSFRIGVTDGNAYSYLDINVKINGEPSVSFTAAKAPQGGSCSGQFKATDPENDPLTYSIASQGSHGTATINSSTGEYTYASTDPSFHGVDSFTVSVSDGFNTKTINVSVEVLKNATPDLSGSMLSVGQGGSGSGRLEATDPENDPLTYSIASQGSHGTATINSSTGEYTYTSTDPSFHGVDSFTVAVSDGFNTKIVSVEVEVVKNVKPSGEEMTLQLTSGSSVEGQFAASDPEGDALAYSISAQGEKGTAFIDEQTGRFVYSADKDTEGYDCFVVTVSDGFNKISYLVEVDIQFVDSNNSWAIPTTIATGTTTALSLGALAFVLIRFKKKI